MLKWAIYDLLTKLGLGIASTVRYTLAKGIAMVVVVLVAVLAYYVTRFIVSRVLIRFLTDTDTHWGDILVRRKVFHTLSHLAPAVVLYALTPLALEGDEQAILFVDRCVSLYVIAIGWLVVNATLNAAHDIYQTLSFSDLFPIKGFVQALKIAAFALAGILIASLILNLPLLYLLSGLGVALAALSFAFHDIIRGFVAGVQLMAMGLVSQGDWIEVPEYGADGEVVDISLTTLKVRNWDMTVTTVPNEYLMTKSFKNWQAMYAAGGRRIKRAVYIDMTTIQVCTPEMVDAFARIPHVAGYIAQKRAESEGEQLTNLGVFRAYVAAYLQQHPLIHPSRPDMDFTVHHLAPTAQGLPMEIWVFCTDTATERYEAIQSDIFEHILAMVPAFELRVFQSPTGVDVRSRGS